jgi:hypothetical protein
MDGRAGHLLSEGGMGMEIERSAPPPRVQPKRQPPLDHVVIRALPKVVFLYPTLLVALGAWIGTWQGWGSHTLWGHVFLIAFAINLIVLAFEFPRTTSLTLFFLIVAAVLGAILLNQREDIFPWLEGHSRRLTPAANAQFYAVIAVVLFAIFALVAVIHTWFDYWEVLSNELIHHHGVLGNIERLPAPGITLEKEITDVFEFALLGSGRLVITPAGAGRSIVLDNVPRIERAERRIKAVLGVTEVEIQPR